MHPYLVNDTYNRILKSNTKTLAQNAISLKVTPFRTMNAIDKSKELTDPEIIRIIESKTQIMNSSALEVW